MPLDLTQDCFKNLPMQRGCPHPRVFKFREISTWTPACRGVGGRQSALLEQAPQSGLTAWPWPGSSPAAWSFSQNFGSSCAEISNANTAPAAHHEGRGCRRRGASERGSFQSNSIKPRRNRDIRFVLDDD